MPPHDQSKLEKEKAQQLFVKVKEMRRCGQRRVARSLFVLASKAMRCAIEYDRLAEEVIETWKYTLTGLEDLYLKRVILYNLYDEFNVLYEQYYGYDDFCDQYGL
jgi:hypothetical protein